MPNANHIRIELSANAARLKRDLAEAQSFVNGAARSFNSAFSTMRSALGVLGIGFGASYFASFIKSALDAEDRLAKLSQSLGISTESLSGLNYSAGLSGVSLDALATGLKKLSVNMADMQAGTGDARYAFEALGLRVEQSKGVLKSSEQVLSEVADKFANMEDGAGKTALAVKLFGKAGADMIPLLNQGAKGLRDNAEEARKLGIVLSTKAAKAAEAFNDDLTRLGVSLDALKHKMAGGLVGATSQWVADTVEAIKIAGSFGEAMRLFVFNLDAMTSEKPGVEIRRLTKDLEDFKKASAIDKFAQSPTGVIFGGREDDLKKQIEFLKYLQRAQALSATAGMDTSDQVSRMAGRATKNKAPALPDFAAMRAAAAEGERLRQLDSAGWIKKIEADIAEYEDGLKVEAEMYTAANAEEAAAHAKMMQQVFAEIDAEQAREIENGRILLEYTKSTTDEMTEFWRSAAQNMQSSMGEFFFDVMQGNLSDLAGSFKKTVDRMVANALAAKALTALVGPAFEKGGAIGGVVGKVLGSFATGTSYVPKTGPYMLHQGEKVVPAAENAASSIVVNQAFNISGPIDGRSRQQIEAAALAGAQRALARNM